MRRPEPLERRQQAMRQRWQAGEVRCRPGRPRRRLDPDLVYLLALEGMTHAEIAGYLRCDRKTLERHCEAVLRKAAARRSELLPRPLWQHFRASDRNLSERAAALEADCLSWAEMERMLEPETTKGDIPRKRRRTPSPKDVDDRSNKVALLAETPRPAAPGKGREARCPDPEKCVSPQKIRTQVEQGNDLAPEFCPKGLALPCAACTLPPLDQKNTPEPAAIDQKNHPQSPAPSRRPWRWLEVLW